MSDKAKGFAVIGVLIVGAILGVVGGMGWYAYSNHRNKERANDAVSITSSTLSGTITEGPTSPTSQGSEGSETAVANHTIQALNRKGMVIASTKTDTQGKYLLRLGPGQYNLSLIPPIKPGVTTVGSVNVKSGVNTLNLSVDTGIR